MSQIANDLEQKLFDDIQFVIRRYVQMARIAEVPITDTWLSLVAVLTGRLIAIIQHWGLPKELFLEMMQDQWDSIKNKEATR